MRQKITRISKKNYFKKRVFGIDPGTATVGWAVIEEDFHNMRPIAFGYISTSSRTEASKRIKEISEDLEKLVKKYNPHEAVIEDIFFFKNLKTAVRVSESRGAIILTLEKKNLKIFSYTPLQVKLALTGYGRADKKQIQVMTKNILKLRKIPKPDDVADALALAICHLNSQKMNRLKQ